jgi:glucose-1-phosphate thymidylyltransferase
MNGDNLYPTHALTDLAGLDEPGLPAFDRDDLVRTSNIPAERISAFAVIEVDDTGYLTRIVEKPAERAGRSSDRDCGSAAPELISMNCWRFDARIFDACRAVSRSARGEFELPEAVGDAIRGGMKVKALMARGPVLDLSRRADTADIARRLQGTVPRP